MCANRQVVKHLSYIGLVKILGSQIVESKCRIMIFTLCRGGKPNMYQSKLQPLHGPLCVDIHGILGICVSMPGMN